MMAWDIAYAKLKEQLDSQSGLVSELDERVQELTERVERFEAVVENVKEFLEQSDEDDLETWKNELRERLSKS